MRGQEIEDGVYHLVVDVVVKHIDGTYLIMVRDLNKNIYPGKLELTAGGSALKGEDPYHAIKRELKEETGIDSNHFIKLGTHVGKNHNLHIIFSTTVDIDKNSVKLQEGETIGYQWVIEKTLHKIKDNLASFVTYDFLFK